MIRQIWSKQDGYVFFLEHKGLSLKPFKKKNSYVSLKFKLIFSSAAQCLCVCVAVCSWWFEIETAESRSRGKTSLSAVNTSEKVRHAPALFFFFFDLNWN